ncbi:cryptochrome/photolyase family protein [Thermocoleostomius sinensis]|uniref:Cryptochrome/photolyase family protein n=1 Tax=Thermocoleostomius sinensis A174 TaxID=2016057 RepID=A0A9E8ZAL7_9CYAN|nr:cryptochrome/photolyase family protein [Thermocoleostomius sinensis]WAL59623.1 cryptochrome/photolyase family protein [Thermocoleostomius sinensis A174]
MTVGVWVLGDQLWTEQAALQPCADRPSATPVILIESLQHVRHRPYHQQKLVLVWSAMRHFAEELRQAEWPVTYVTAEDFEAPLRQWIRNQGITDLRIMQPADRPFAQFIQSLELPCNLTIVPNNHFLWSIDDFRQWAKGRKNLLMEYFYREGRQRFNVLMAGKHPIGGRWNFDKENRQPLRGNLKPPTPHWFAPDSITQAVIEQVKTGDFATYGQAEPFRWAVTRSQALQVLEHFIEHRLATFGPYQDAMVTDEETMWHALLSPYLNLGLLHPLEVIRSAERAYHENNLALSSVEGFIRQVLGWREYMYGLYHYVDESYFQKNWFQHTQSLPRFFWNASEIEMNCLRQTLSQVERIGYAHHIQRLMILSNFALISGLSPQQVENWFHAAFIDGYDWVMQTNVIGMGLFADGGVVGSKPYASSANYINKMSDYCKQCRYNPTDRTGDTACPFNFFYWDFLDRHRHVLQSQGRMSFILRNLDKFSDTELQAIRQKASDWHQQHL